MKRISTAFGLAAPCIVTAFASAQTPRLFLVPAGMPPSSSTPGMPIQIEVLRGSALSLDVYVEVNNGPTMVTGIQFALPCTIAAGIGAPISYSPASLSVDGSSLLGCTNNWFDQAAAGSCPADPPGGLAATPLGSACALSSPVLVGSLTYNVPIYIPEPTTYEIRPASVILTDANQVPIAGVQMDGVDAIVCCPPIPAASAWGMAVLVIALLCAGTLLARSCCWVESGTPATERENSPCCSQVSRLRTGVGRTHH